MPLYSGCCRSKKSGKISALSRDPLLQTLIHVIQTYEQFKSQLPYSDCRYCIYDQDYKTADGRPASKLWFISWFPKSSTVHVKMAYTSAKGKFREAILGVFDTQVSSLEELDANLGLGSAEDDEDDKDFDF